MFRLRSTIPLLLAALAISSVPAQDDPDQRMEILIEAEGFSKIKIAVPSAASAADLEAAELLESVRADLDFSGFFDVVDPSLYRLVPSAGSSTVDHEDWLAIGADAMLQTRVSVEAGRVDLEARLYDNPSETLLFARRYGGTTSLLRRVAHQLADDLVQHYTGRKGIASTRIAFVSRHGDGKEIYLMDYDGRRVRRLTTTSTINLSPAWSPDGQELSFVSWRGRQPGVYVMSSEGKLGELATVGGELSTSPEWSPDGRRLAYTSDVDGDMEIYVLDRPAGRNRRLTHNPAIDSAPAFSSNGREIAFTSDRTGVPQIYVMDAEGLNVRRVSWSGNYNDSAAWSPRGDLLAYASRVEGRFEIVVLDLGTGRATQITRGRGNKENPRWSPDGRHLVFASDQDGSYQIYTVRADGSDLRKLTRGRDSYTPDWSR